MQLVFEHLVLAPVQTVFAFHQRPENLALLLYRWRAFRLIRDPGRIRLGSRIWMEARLGWCVPVVLGFQSVDLDPPRRHEERLIHGPFARFDHVHEYEGRGDETLVRDVIRLELPRHYGGELALRVFAAPRIRRAFALRGVELRRLALAGKLESLVAQGGYPC